MKKQDKSSEETPESLFHYLDYRKFLQDWYQNSKQAYGFSFRAFCRRAGFKSPSLYRLVADGQRNLTEESLKKFMKGLRLTKEEREYFRHLVYFNQAKTHEEKNQHYRKLISCRQYQELKPMVQDQYEYYSTWYHPVVRELLVADGFKGKLSWVVKRIRPAVTLEQVQASVKLIERLGLIEKIPKTSPTRWRQSTPLVSSGHEVASTILFNYHRSVLELVKDQMSQVPWQDRDISALTLGVVRQRLPQLKKKIQEFRREVLKLVSSDEKPEEVILLSTQLLPLTQLQVQRGNQS